MDRNALKKKLLREGLDLDERARYPTFRRGSEMPWEKGIDLEAKVFPLADSQRQLSESPSCSGF